MVDDSSLSSSGAKEVLFTIVREGGNPKDIAAAKNLLQVSDTGELEKIVATVLESNPKAVDDLKAGQMQAIGFLVGQIMKASQGKANPELSHDLIKKQLQL